MKAEQSGGNAGKLRLCEKQKMISWYTTLLNACGNPFEHYGELDVALEKTKRNQKGLIKQFV